MAEVVGDRAGVGGRLDPRLGLSRIFVAFIEPGDQTGTQSPLTTFIITATIKTTRAGPHSEDP